ncbi:thiamine import ATP-binding protein ThiQ-like [Ylistrum balloti]|uniref:thiamine import ATP-binding protein ThiQ-like n=1 Tax=Ylistrum balloti TaxID=509963 RepID=UPI002905D67D|nr:thiamine import ATP-binding protein ThiQ-like [Ylistrum balloti]
MGNNGMGKSTFLRTASGLLPPRSGTITWLDDNRELNISKTSPYMRSQLLGAIFPSQAPFYLQVSDYIAAATLREQNLLFSKDQQADLWAAMSELNIEQLSGKRVNELSSGQWQRVQLARLWLQQVPLWFLDEPTAHLDWHSSLQLYHWLRQQADDYGRTIVLTSHDWSSILTIADQILLFDDQDTQNYFWSPEAIAQQTPWSQDAKYSYDPLQHVIPFLIEHETWQKIIVKGTYDQWSLHAIRRAALCPVTHPKQEKESLTQLTCVFTTPTSGQLALENQQFTFDTIQELVRTLRYLTTSHFKSRDLDI